MARYGPAPWNIDVLQRTPILEQLNMGLQQAESFLEYAAALALVTTTFGSTALILLPVGQLCGAPMERRPTLQAYGLNLVGSLAGVGFMFALSLLWAPPVLWFAAPLAFFVAMQSHQPRAAVIAVTSAVAVLVLLAWPVSYGWERVYSPYQLIERGTESNGPVTLRAAGHYYQRVLDLRPQALVGEYGALHRSTALHYELPYEFHPQPNNVLVVGAASLRRSARHADRQRRAHVPAVDRPFL